MAHQQQLAALAAPGTPQVPTSYWHSSAQQRSAALASAGRKRGWDFLISSMFPYHHTYRRPELDYMTVPLLPSVRTRNLTVPLLSTILYAEDLLPMNPPVLIGPTAKLHQYSYPALLPYMLLGHKSLHLDQTCLVHVLFCT